jgi:hypothetical protein
MGFLTGCFEGSLHEDGVGVGKGLRLSHSGTEAGHQHQVPPVGTAVEGVSAAGRHAPGGNFGAVLQWHPEIGGGAAGLDAIEQRRGDADNGEGYAVNVDGLADHFRIAAETARPVAVADDGKLGVPVFVGCGKGLAGGHARAERSEEVAADLVGGNLFRRVAEADGGFSERERDVGDEIGENGPVSAQTVVDVDAVGVHRVAGVSDAIRHMPVREIEELIRLAHRKRAQQHGIHHTENSRVGSNAKCERHDNGKRKGGNFAQLTQRIANILEQRVHGGFSGSEIRDQLRIWANWVFNN